MSNYASIPCPACEALFIPRSTRQKFCSNANCTRERKRQSAEKSNHSKRQAREASKKREQLLSIPKAGDNIQQVNALELSFPKRYPVQDKERYLRLARAVSLHPMLKESREVLTPFLNL